MHNGITKDSHCYIMEESKIKHISNNNIQKIFSLGHIPKFDETYFWIWKHKSALLFKNEKVCAIIKGI